ncbi:MAG: DmsE family decaheme c-type cytochrome [Halioglobus sp.]|nr:DmsE family decaheme c-type cytochrome [Halioglobus sp.]
MALPPGSRALLSGCCVLLSAALAAGREAGCLDCHTAAADAPVHAVLRTVHGNLGEGRAQTCRACHGDSPAHAREPAGEAPEVSFGPRWRSGIEVRNGSCLACHQANGPLLSWQGSSHQREDLACDSCHTSHSQRDGALDEDTSSHLCGACHQPVRAQLRLPSRHPIAEGKTACSDCHNPHGGSGEADLYQVSVNDNCLSCHQDKRGPFLWEHAPVAEDCALCHRPHGSVHERLLSARGPALCQQCHAAAFHPSLPYGRGGLPGGAPNPNLLGKNCLNCHSQVHGSNHPSGARLTR